ncbi:MAG: hypothetical protein AB1469_08540 [Pseudomonadota bacterium]
MNSSLWKSPLCVVWITTLLASLAQPAQAMPVFARQYNLTCVTCHAAFPRLNSFGKDFIANNYRLPNWRETTADVGDEMLALPKFPPLALRAQAYVTGRQGEEIDPVTGPTGNDADFDFQAPYLIKLLSSAPLSEHITYYFYGIFAEKGANGTTTIEDAWFRHDDLFGSGVGAQLGQFQLSDLMFPRETRLTVQDFMPYRLAGVTYDRGILFDRDVGPLSLALGAVNGNGIDQNFNVNSPGFNRPDRLFDNDRDKSVFGRIGADVGPASVGLFGLNGKQKSIAAGNAGTQTGARKTDKRVLGIDVSGDNGQLYWFAQGLWNQWDNFLDQNPDRDYTWFGGFAGVDYVHSDRWVFSLLYNYADNNDFENTGTVFEGIEINTLTATASYYFMRNVKGVIEATVDFQSEDDDPGFVGHETKEGYILVGIDAAF